MLFDLDANAAEQNDQAGTARYAETRTALERELITVLGDCPEKINQRALQDQAALIEAHGGLAAVLNTATLSATSAPLTRSHKSLSSDSPHTHQSHSFLNGKIASSRPAIRNLAATGLAL